MIKSVYELNIEQYQTLLESGQGETIYGKSFPANSSVFLSEQAKYFAVLQLYHLAQNFSNASGCSAADFIEFIKQYGETIADIENDIMNGLISDKDMEDIIAYVDGRDD